MSENPHPCTSLCLTAQRNAFQEYYDKHKLSIKDQRLISKELLWHAMFLVYSLDPNLNGKELVAYTRDATMDGVAYGIMLGNINDD